VSRIPTPLALRIVGVAATVYALAVFMLAVQLSVAIGGALTWGIPIAVAVLMVTLLWYRQTIAATGCQSG
jgi:hypothetical protein